MSLIRQKLDELRAKFVDTFLGISVITGTITQVITVIRDYPEYVTLLTFVRFSLLIIFLPLYFFRKHIASNLKIFLLLLLHFTLFYLSVTNLGFFSGLKIFIVFGPVFLIFLLPRSISILVAIVFSGIYLYSSWMLMEGSHNYTIPPANLITNIYHWSVELGFSILCTIAVIILIQRFRTELNQSIRDFESKNKSLEESKKEIDDINSNLERMIDEKTKDLKQIVADLANQNRELKSSNSSIQQYNKEIAEATSQLSLVHERMVMSDKLSSLGLLTAGVCHEIKNPLHHIYGSVRILEGYLATSNAPQDQIKLLEVVDQGVIRIKKIIDSLNQFDHAAPTTNEWVDLVRVIENCRGITQHLFSPNMYYQFESKYKAVEIAISSDSLHQVILNILQNAVEALDNKGTVHVALLASEDKAIVEISDTGCGISNDLKKAVTDPFFTTKSTDLHTGLGLYHVQKIMNDIGGKLIIDSEEDRGTIVRLIFNGKVKIK